MDYSFIRELLTIAEQFESENQSLVFSKDMAGFTQWMLQGKSSTACHTPEPDWDGKKNGRMPESVISTMIVHMNRFAKTYSKSAIHGSPFSTQEEFIYLITLKAYGEMTKMELIRKNVHDKPVGMLIVNRLIQQGWVKQVNSEVDKRSKVLQLTTEGAASLEQVKEKIDNATRVVSGDLTRDEQLILIRLLQKLEQFHRPIFQKNIDRQELLDQAMTLLPHAKN